MKRDLAHLLDIVHSARLAGDYMDGISPDELMADNLLQDAVLRRIEVIGEAARRLSMETRMQIDEVPWTEIIAMRNLVIHEYDDVDINTVWQTVKTDLPLLITQLEKYLPQNSE